MFLTGKNVVWVGLMTFVAMENFIRSHFGEYFKADI
jgi:hypothetical protein